jgi:hypothetical protein
MRHILTLCLWREGQCPLSDKCHRAQADPGDNQSWFAPPVKGDGCPYFIEEDK